MAYELKLCQHLYDRLKCKISGDIIGPGDYYFQDDEDPTIIISADTYDRLVKENKEDTFDESILTKAESWKDYEETLKEYTKDYLERNIHKANFVYKKAY